MKNIVARIRDRKTILVLGATLVFTSIVTLCQTAPAKSPARPAAASTVPSSASPELLEQLRAIRDAALGSDYAWHQLAHLTENIGPRPAGSAASPGGSGVRGRRTAPSWPRGSSGTGTGHALDSRGRKRPELVEYPGQAPGHNATHRTRPRRAGSSATPADGINAHVVVVHSFEKLAALGRDKVAGKIVLFNVLYDERKAACRPCV